MDDNFRSLYPGFEIYFHSLQDIKAMEEFRPFCFAGLNGRGKSNVLEALANIFYHLEICVARYLPDSIRDTNRGNFKRDVCNPDAFELEYLIGQHNEKLYQTENFHKVTITKLKGKEPEMYIQEFSLEENVSLISIPLKPNLDTDEPAPGKRYLPDHVVGYSSGENEILSLPFIKSRLVHLDEFKQYTQAGVEEYSEPENSLIYIDNQMSQAVLLSCLLLEDFDALNPLKKETGIQHLESFRMHLNMKNFIYPQSNTKPKVKPILSILEVHQLDKLKRCATSWFANEEEMVLDFYVGKDNEEGTNATKDAFRYHFNNSSFELFQAFRILYELNNHFVSDTVKEEVYRSQGFYTDGKLPVCGPEEDVFHFLDFMIMKKLKDSDVEKPLLLREFSDGEHQLIHTMGICLLLKEKRTLLLLDEPETHFNPSWRAKFVKMLNEGITARNKKDYVNGSFNVHLLKDIILTSHSPFVISDCLPNNVIFFDKDEQTKKLKAKKASDMGIKTYGAGVDYILKNVFKTQMISSQSFDQLKELIATGTLDELRDAVEYFGESSHKQFLFKRIFELTENTNDSTH